MSFKFKLGDMVIPKEKKDVGAAKIEAFYLNGFMRILRLDNNTKYIVKEIDYENSDEEEILQFNY